ncbi:hypothetical protein [Methylocystis parvus]|uniref:hypothetical protein n=1 Tax=Methylocystis parvus TaxID=134 RepID=UPI0002DF84EC|nr:hypothetical protein [Methylocystis parvus]WBJ98436.1 hypothetical protein MMG94_10335 [Methylocystis parvus OBBP]
MTRIALKLGYSTPAIFSRVFSEMTGLSPRARRREAAGMCAAALVSPPAKA